MLPPRLVLTAVVYGPIRLALLSLASIGLVLCVFMDWSRAEPEPGDVFREYRWTNSDGDAGGSLRVGGKVGYGGKNIKLDHSFDLQHATRAEVVIEKLLCHAGTRMLEISVNDHPWIVVPEAPGIPKPQWEYQHHIYPVLSIPVTQLRAGNNNHFRLRVSDNHPWNWPQNLIYGVHFRIYYDASSKEHPMGQIVSPASGDHLGQLIDLLVTASSPNAEITRVDFLGEFENVNLEGDGRYRQWHHHYVKSELSGHIGSKKETPWNLRWDTSWIPDQSRPIRLAAWITDHTGLTFCSPIVDRLTLQRDRLSVELCKPYDVPQKWVTRSGEHTEKVRISGDLSHAVQAKLVWCSWSPDYMEGVYINDRLVLEREGPRYDYHVHQVPIDDLSVLRPGENTIRTGRTPKYDGKMVHGMEVNWPGIMLLIRYHHKAQTP